MRGAAGHALASRLGEARRLTAQVHERDPTLRIANLPNLIPFSRAQDVARWTEGPAKGRFVCVGSRYQHSRLSRRLQPAFISRSYALFHQARKPISPRGFPVICRPRFGSYPFGMNQDLPKFRDLPYDCSCVAKAWPPSAACRASAQYRSWSPTNAPPAATSKPSRGRTAPATRTNQDLAAL